MLKVLLPISRQLLLFAVAALRRLSSSPTPSVELVLFFLRWNNSDPHYASDVSTDGVKQQATLTRLCHV